MLLSKLYFYEFLVYIVEFGIKLMNMIAKLETQSINVGVTILIIKTAKTVFLKFTSDGNNLNIEFMILL